MYTPNAHARRAQAADLLDHLEAIRQYVDAEGRRTYARWRPKIKRRSICGSALNLAHYLALRKRDLRPLQQALSPWGLSSLGRSEAHVMASLEAVVATLTLIAKPQTEAQHRHPALHRFTRGERALRRNIGAIFGPSSHDRHVRIMVTLPTEAAADYVFVRDLVVRGMDCARINCAHDDAAVWGAMIEHVRRAERETELRCRVMMDLGGPKARTGKVIIPEKRRVHIGDQILLTRTPPQADKYPAYAIQVQSLLPEALDAVKAGQHVWIDDGKLGARVEVVLPEGAVLRVTNAGPDGEKLRSEKGLNFPESDLELDPLTQEDLAALDFVAHHADLIGYSFVQEGRDMARFQDELAKRLPQERARQIGVIAKIETQRAVRNLPEILIQAAGKQPFGVMIARGDLAVELGFQRLAEMQEQLLWICEAAHAPVIWATQVLESYVKKGVPTRAEMTDAAMSARADCVMLNKGAFIGEAVTLLDDVLKRMQEHQVKKTAQLRALRSWVEY
jgi:pyruvate kinase